MTNAKKTIIAQLNKVLEGQSYNHHSLRPSLSVLKVNDLFNLKNMVRDLLKTDRSTELVMFFNEIENSMQEAKKSIGCYSKANFAK